MYFRLFVKLVIVFVVTAAVADAKQDRFEVLKKFECVSDVVKEFCVRKCGPSHFCLLGRCFCGYKEAEDADEELQSALLQSDDSPQEETQSEESSTKPRRKAVVIHTFLNTDDILSTNNDIFYRGQQHKKPKLQFDKLHSANIVQPRSDISQLLPEQSPQYIFLMPPKKSETSLPMEIQNLPVQKKLQLPKSSWKLKEITKPQNTKTLYQLQSSGGIVNKPVLRHHIAHFCPNLDVARKCIRKCMKVGKPAFCGKDHVCYCGHNYGDHSENNLIDPELVRQQYKDLYTKYFGPLTHH